MKKIIFVFFVILFSITSVYAFENEYFKIYIPNGYEIETNDNDNRIFKWTNNDDYIVVTVDNNDNKYSVKDYTENDILNQKKYLEQNINTALEEYNVDVNVSKIFKNKIGDYYSLQYDLYWPTKEITGKDTYQRGNVFTTGKYIITYLYSSESEIKDDNEVYNNTINSFKILDETEIKKELTIDISFIIIVGVVLAILSFILSEIKKKKATK